MHKLSSWWCVYSLSLKWLDLLRLLSTTSRCLSWCIWSFIKSVVLLRIDKFLLFLLSDFIVCDWSSTLCALGQFFEEVDQLLGWVVWMRRCFAYCVCCVCYVCCVCCVCCVYCVCCVCCVCCIVWRKSETKEEDKGGGEKVREKQTHSPRRK